MEVTETPCSDVERRLPAFGLVRIEDDRRIRTALVLGEPVDDRMPTDFLLAVARDPDIHRQRSLRRQQRGGLEQQVELPLVVCDAARVEPLVPDRRFEW